VQGVVGRPPVRPRLGQGLAAGGGVQCFLDRRPVEHAGDLARPLRGPDGDGTLVLLRHALGPEMGP